ncbi:FecR family protein [Gaoshiqia sediminis]|uniref:FecR domain-containing protein n=1 Tax=Gaoshiqia sediminis TaxID=2986998 RepID=A0AA41Y4M2_9BACT|nr:FecR domain-containing protein [Gaoshiqia sediminis]MCW0481824.1 FecR domain-containing protein [Gaoshiqia sediminis]
MADLEKYIEDKRFIKWVYEPDPETEAYFASYLEAHPDEKTEFLRVKKELSLLKVKQLKPDTATKERIYHEITAARPAGKTGHLVRFNLAVWVRYAAVAIFFFAIGSLFMYEFGRNAGTMPVAESLLVKSASQNTMVYLADGSQREIGHAQTVIDFSHSGHLVVENDTIKIGKTFPQNSKNLVVVPHGKRAVVKLYDNSEVKLNAGSRIILPDAFSKETRNAYLVGEAFFDIRKDPAHPFLVETSSAVVKVLGTSFHLAAYPDREEVSTFLQEGVVRFRAADHGLFTGWVELKPNEQATFSRASQKIAVTRGDETYYRLWKDGIVQFNNETVQQLINRVEQYFNITVRLPDPQVGDLRISGKLDLNKDLNEVFEYVELITDKKVVKENAGAFSLN